MQGYIKYCFTIIITVLWVDLSCADSTDSHSLFSYTGYLTTPSAYISDAQWNFSYSYFSNSFPINDHIASKNSEIWNFSSSLGLFPFMEILFSVYVLPQDNISKQIPNYGANKWRTGGAKLRIITERKYTPTIALGMIDPDLKDIGASISAPNLSSSYVILSKKMGFNNSAISLGYGFDHFAHEKNRMKLNEVFGGFNLGISDNYSLICDYDGRYWSVGSTIQWKNIDLLFSYTEGNYVASRIGYNFDLLRKNECEIKRYKY